MIKLFFDLCWIKRLRDVLERRFNVDGVELAERVSQLFALTGEANLAPYLYVWIIAVHVM